MEWKQLLILCISFGSVGVKAQTAGESSHAKLLFGGDWYSKKDKLHMRLFFDGQYEGEVLVNEWKGKGTNIDAYKALIKGDKLIMPEEHGDHNAPYCEMLIVNKKLLFRCKGFLLKETVFTDSTWFVKVAE